MTRTQIVQYFINRYNYNSYLEIGVLNTSFNFDRIKCALKVGVDPAIHPAFYTVPDAGHMQTSDDYFNNLSDSIKFDIIFIDGLHTREQVNEDIKNSLNHLTENGTIVLHDCSPPVASDEATPRRCGDVWKSIYELRKTTNNLFIGVVDTDYGVGIVRRGTPVPLPSLNDSVLDYNFLVQHRKSVLNLISVGDFMKGSY